MSYETKEERIAALSRVKMPNGTGGRPPNGKTGSMCVMECVAWVAGEDVCDAPACASPVLRRLAVCLNDGPWWESDAERTRMLLPLVVLLAGSRDDARELARVKAVRGWAVALRYETALVRAETAAKKLEAMWPEDAKAIRVAADVLRGERTIPNARELQRVARAAAYAAYLAAADAADAADAAYLAAADAADAAYYAAAYAYAADADGADAAADAADAADASAASADAYAAYAAAYAYAAYAAASADADAAASADAAYAAADADADGADAAYDAADLRAARVKRRDSLLNLLTSLLA